MVVGATLRARLRVAARPHARVHGVDARIPSDERMACEQVPQGIGVDSSTIQRGVEAAPATTVQGLEA